MRCCMFASPVFQSTLPVWGATRKRTGEYFIHGISIHAPRVGSDLTIRYSVSPCTISIHAPRVGNDRQSTD